MVRRISVEDELKCYRKLAVGVDLGIKHFLTDTEGRQIKNPKFSEKSLERVKAKRKQPSKKERDRRREKASETRRVCEKLVGQQTIFSTSFPLLRR